MEYNHINVEECIIVNINARGTADLYLWKLEYKMLCIQLHYIYNFKYIIVLEYKLSNSGIKMYAFKDINTILDMEQRHNSSEEAR